MIIISLTKIVYLMTSTNILVDISYLVIGLDKGKKVGKLYACLVEHLSNMFSVFK